MRSHTELQKRAARSAAAAAEAAEQDAAAVAERLGVAEEAVSATDAAPTALQPLAHGGDEPAVGTEKAAAFCSRAQVGSR